MERTKFKVDLYLILIDIYYLLLVSIHFFQHSSGNEDMILSKETVEKMFKHDIKFAANQVVDTKDLR